MRTSHASVADPDPDPDPVAIAFPGPARAVRVALATELRAARLGIEGTAWRNFEYRLEVDFADDEVDITDAFVEYDGAPIEPAYVRVGQFKTPNSLEEQTSSRFTTFMERAGFTDAFDLNRRIGAQVGAGADDWSLAAGLFSQNMEEVSEDEGFAAAARGTYAFRFAEDRLLHVGASTRYRELDNDSDDGTVQYRQRPFFHFTSTRSVDIGEIEDAEGDLLFGGEAALVRGAFSLQAEAAHTWLYRDGADDVDGLWGGYLSASYFLTGESRAYDGVRGALRHQLAVRAVPPAGHAVGDHGREQALDRAEERERQRVRQDGDEPLHREGRQPGRRQAVRDAAEAAADRLHRQAEERARGGGCGDRDQHRRPVRPVPAHGEDHGHGDAGHGHGRGADGRQRVGERGELREERPRLLGGQGQPEQLLELAREDDDGDAGGEPHRHRVRDVLDEGAEPQEADREQEQPGEHGRD
jgi:Phosphate-selective porin O and P